MAEIKNILIVDDEQDVLNSLKRLLWDYRQVWEITLSDDPVKAMDLAIDGDFDAAILDIKMPKMNGLEMLEEFQANPALRVIQVIILTGLEDRELKRRALDMGAADLLNKPVDKDDLVARLSSVLRVKSYMDEIQQHNRELQRQLVQSQKMELVGILSAGVIHDLKNILQIIQGYSELMALDLSGDDKYQEPLKNINDAADRANNLMRQILRFSKPMDQQAKTLDLSEAVDENIKLLRILLPRGVSIIWQRPLDNFLINSDLTQMSQVLINLIINAGQASKEGDSVKISLSSATVNEVDSAEEQVIKPGKYCRLDVADSGVGMDENTLKNIFKSHFTTKSDQGGSGLGLTVVKWIVDTLKGFISVQSSPGKGSTFTIHFPQAGS